ncbi:IclR family transcriptional regulator [Alicyclobacillus fastidiosus]|uniref:IclR family transcriptional regulator n=1 Tax=Alicyclobacillus fastidiosus TaxID=392011 RepID=A0ABV5AGJ6_9BACL|nr:IclR family transcriptional regulator [Alicyclobacillus fastidiosus]WEH07960.1 IclR family transcriptional regulator [Alicyclobacillus fastidiosus]
MTTNSNDKNRKIQSVEIGFSILKSIATARAPQTLGALSQDTGLHKSQLYRYLNTFVDLGVLTRHDQDTPRWSLGPELIGLGQVAAATLDVHIHAAPITLKLRDALQETVAVSIWRAGGPFFVGWEKSNKVVNIGLGAGAYVPLYTATGKIFRAFLPEAETQEVYDRDVSAGRIQPEAYAKDIAQVRKDGLARTRGSLQDGVAAVSAPIYGPLGNLVGALSVLGVLGFLDDSLDGPVVAQLRRAAMEVSVRLGYQAGQGSM